MDTQDGESPESAQFHQAATRPGLARSLSGLCRMSNNANSSSTCLSRSCCYLDHTTAQRECPRSMTTLTATAVKWLYEQSVNAELEDLKGRPLRRPSLCGQNCSFARPSETKRRIDWPHTRALSS
eukprot:777870-Amphidinium_carterae.1